MSLRYGRCCSWRFLCAEGPSGDIWVEFRRNYFVLAFQILGRIEQEQCRGVSPHSFIVDASALRRSDRKCVHSVGRRCDMIIVVGVSYFAGEPSGIFLSGVAPQLFVVGASDFLDNRAETLFSLGTAPFLVVDVSALQGRTELRGIHTFFVGGRCDMAVVGVGVSYLQENRGGTFLAIFVEYDAAIICCRRFRILGEPSRNTFVRHCRVLWLLTLRLYGREPIISAYTLYSWDAPRCGRCRRRFKYSRKPSGNICCRRFRQVCAHSLRPMSRRCGRCC